LPLRWQLRCCISVGPKQRAAKLAAESLGFAERAGYPARVANEELVRSVKEIIGRAKSGDTEGAYRGYRDLFASPAFAGYRVEDQRQALQLMVLMKGAPKPATGPVVVPTPPPETKGADAPEPVAGKPGTAGEKPGEVVSLDSFRKK